MTIDTPASARDAGSGPLRPDRAAAPEKPAVRPGAPRLLLPIVVPLLVALIVATGYLLIREPRDPAGLGRWAGAPASAPPAENMTGAPNPFRTVPSDLSGPPARLRVAAIGVDTALETLKLGTDGALQPPRTNERAGWYADGTAPGDVGPAVLAGHVDSRRGPAVFYRLRELTTGDKIEVVRGGRTVTFTVTATAWYPKKAFPTDEVYGPTPDRQLRLITCGGVFDRTLRSYRDNLVVYAVAG
ncbi:class F sortase [Amorphoplanes nipponensis]|uniref:Class F sortase n=1 Tax=Actinoplanes nipponensis TaxID=135950 RepID=A0A919JMC9_9ACTN|nr:class F sortase [Actinoplanes nipponensis]GIE53246.1 class F sortase [Actinoplanes nipponensis]